MYDLQWTRSIVEGFRKVCARAINIDLCIIDTAKDLERATITQAQIYRALVFSLQRHDKSRLWYKYRRLCKRSPLDIPLLQDVTRLMLAQSTLQREDALQFRLDFA